MILHRYERGEFIGDSVIFVKTLNYKFMAHIVNTYSALLELDRRYW